MLQRALFLRILNDSIPFTKYTLMYLDTFIQWI